MQISGQVKKMTAVFQKPVEYFLELEQKQININQFIGKNLSIEYRGEIICMSCGKPTVKSFAQGYCFPCLKTAPETSPCVLQPELCEAHLGIYRDKQWAEEHCLIPQYVYLAVSGNIKVGVTRENQIPTRWIDQGATYAIKFAKVPNRYLAGMLEIELKKHISDKTNWQQMLKNKMSMNIDLIERKNNLTALLPSEYKQYISTDNEITYIDFPVKNYPAKIKSINLDNDRKYIGKLAGIKGQYLLFEDEYVINIRKYSGYILYFTFDE